MRPETLRKERPGAAGSSDDDAEAIPLFNSKIILIQLYPALQTFKRQVYMRATGHLFLVALTGTMGSLMAYTPPGPGEIEAVGEFLYLLPSTDNSYFVIDADASNTLPVGQRENNDFDFAPGFRIGAAYGFCNCNRNVQAYFSRIDTTQNKTLTGDFLWATTGNPDLASAFENYGGSANSHRNLLYERGDFLFAQQIVNCCGLKISPQHPQYTAQKDGRSQNAQRENGTVHLYQNACSEKHK